MFDVSETYTNLLTPKLVPGDQLNQLVFSS